MKGSTYYPCFPGPNKSAISGKRRYLETFAAKYFKAAILI